MRQLVRLVSLIPLLLFAMNANSQSLCANDTMEKSWQNGTLTLESHHCDSGYYLTLKSEGKVTFHSGFGDGYLGNAWWLELPNKAIGIVLADYYCDARTYTLMVINSDKRYNFYSLYESFAGDECDINPTTELMMKDDNNDGYQELYFNYKKDKDKLISLGCSKKVELKNLLKQ